MTLSAARDSKRSPDTGDLMVQIKLVAGAGQGNAARGEGAGAVAAERQKFKSRPRNHEGGRDAVWSRKMEKATRYHRMAFMVAGAGFEPATFGL